MSVTYGAGGSTREKTIEIVKRISDEYGLEAMAHFTCVGATVPELRATLEEMRAAGIDNVLALRGDPPAGQEAGSKTEGGLEYSRELVELIRADYPFAIGAACFPETHIHAESPEADLEHLAEKVRRGRGLPDHAAVLRQRRLLRLRRPRARGRHRRADHPGHHADHPASGRSSAWPRCAAPRSPRACGASCTRAATTRGGARLRRRLRHAAVRRAARRGRARHPLLHAQPLARHARDPQRAEARQALGEGASTRLDLEPSATRGEPSAAS